MAVRAGAEQNELDSAIEAVRHGVENELNAFLMIKAADEGNYRTELFAQPKAIAERFFVGVFLVNGLDRIALGDVRIRFGIPHIVIEAVENAAEFSVMRTQGTLQAHAEMTVADFESIAGRDRGDKIRIDDAPFHEIDRAMAVIIGQAFVGHDVRRV